MKRRFILDENMLYYSLRFKDEHNRRIREASKFISLVWEKCHIIVLDAELLKRYSRHLTRILRNREDFDIVEQAVNTIKQFYLFCEKRIIENELIGEIPDEDQYPHEDIHIVRLAASQNVDVITIDQTLEDSINASSFFSRERYKSNSSTRCFAFSRRDLR